MPAKIISLIVLLLGTEIKLTGSVDTDDTLEYLNQLCKKNVKDTCVCTKGIEDETIPISCIHCPHQNVHFYYNCSSTSTNNNIFSVSHTKNKKYMHYSYFKCNQNYNTSGFLSLVANKLKPYELSIEKCSLTFNNLEYFRNLHTLELKHCNLTGSKQYFYNNLIVLIILESNPVEAIHNLLNYNNMTKLTTFVLKNSTINIKDYSFSIWSNCLVKLEVEQTNLTEINIHMFNGLASLQYLSVNDNQIEFIQEESLATLTILKEIYLAGNKLSSLPLRLFDNNKMLVKIVLSNNSIKSISGTLFSNSLNLTSLYLSNMKLETIDKNTFRGLSKLSKLDLSKNYLKNVSFHPLPSLELLDLSINRLETILSIPHNVKVLHLHHNQLTFFKIDVTTNIQRITLNGNPWNCNNFVPYVHRHLIKKINVSEIGCTTDSNTIIYSNKVSTIYYDINEVPYNGTFNGAKHSVNGTNTIDNEDLSNVNVHKYIITETNNDKVASNITNDVDKSDESETKLLQTVIFWLSITSSILLIVAVVTIVYFIFRYQRLKRLLNSNNVEEETYEMFISPQSLQWRESNHQLRTTVEAVDCDVEHVYESID